MQAKEVTVRLQALDGVWEVGGRDRKRGIWPENVQLTSDQWGPGTASFDLRRDGRATWPDLGAYTPVEIEVGGVVVWAGRVQQTPTSLTASDRVISVQCQGWQYHLDDDLYEKVYVHTAVSDWRDARTFPSAVLAATAAAAVGQVSSDNGVIQLAWPNGAALATNGYVGVVLDLGPSSTAASVSIDYETSNNSSGTILYCRGHTAPDSSAWVSNDAGWSATPLTTAGALGTVRGTFATPRRYVLIVMLWSGAPITNGADVWVKLKGIRVFGNDAYRSTDASILHASDVAADALTQATVLLNPDRSGITATSFAIPDLSMSGPQTPREAWSAVNAYHDWITQIDVAKRPVFKAKPTAPMYEVGAWSPLELQDQSANSGDDIYNRVIVTGTQPDGTPLRVVRSAGNQANALLRAPLSAAPTNASADTNTTGWSGGTVTRDTTTFDTSPASIKSTSVALAGTFSGTFHKGRTYTILFAAKPSFSGGTIDKFGTRFGDATSGDVSDAILSVSLTDGFGNPLWEQHQMVWTPSADTANTTLSFYATDTGLGHQTTAPFWVDSLRLFEAIPTLVDRRGFVRTKELPVSGALTVAAAQQIGDLWLAAHQTTPYKGSFKLTGDKSVRNPATGTPVKLETLLLHTGELIRDMAAIDPDTGGVGRDGRIAQVTYTPATEEATVTLDNTRASFAALLARLDLVTSVGK